MLGQTILISEGGLFPHQERAWVWGYTGRGNGHLAITPYIDVPSTSFNPFNFSKARAMGVSTGFCRGKNASTINLTVLQQFLYFTILHSSCPAPLFHLLLDVLQFLTSQLSWCHHETHDFSCDLIVSWRRPHFSQSTVPDHDRLTYSL